MKASSTLGWTLAAALALGAGPGAARAGEGDGDGDGAAPDRGATADRAAPVADVARSIDAAIADAWKREGISPNRAATDEEFVRRVHLDLVGTLPTALQVEDFLRDARPDRRERLVDDLLASPGFARHFANRWAEVLVGIGTGDSNRDFVPGLFLPWLERQIASERPYAELVTELLTAQGTPYSNPPVNFTSRLDTNPADLAGAASRAFLGVQIQCAQCHDHPYEEISQRDFQGMAAFWGRMRLRPADIPYEMFGSRAVEREREQQEKRVQEMVKAGTPEAEARVRAARQTPKTRDISDLPGGVKLPKAFEQGRQKVLGEATTGEPRFLAGPVYTDREGETRRGALARWIVDPANPWTSKALANRVWGWLLGRGFVHPIDDFSSVNLPSVPAALDLLAADTAANGFDMKRLVRIVTRTRAYRTSTVGRERPPKAVEFFAAGPLKPLTPQQSFDALAVALGTIRDGRTLSLSGAPPTAIEMEDGRGGMVRPMSETSAESPDRVQLAMSAAARSFFRTFDDDEGGGDAAFEGTVPQGLFLLNSQVVNGMLANSRVSVVPPIVRAHATEKDRIRQLFLRTLSREPTAAEVARFTSFVRSAQAAGPDRGPDRDGRDGRGGREGRGGRNGRAGEDAAAAPYADVLWVLIASSEFGTNH